MVRRQGECQIPRERRGEGSQRERGARRFTNEDHLAVHKHKHEMTLKFGPARTDSVIIADQTPTPTRFLKNCEEVGLFNELASSFEQDDDDKRAKNSLPAPNSVALDMSLQTTSDVKVKKEAPVEVDSSPPDSPESISGRSDSSREALVRGKDTPPRSSAPTPTIVRPGSLPLHLGFDALQPTMPSPTSVITQAPPSNRTLGSPTSHYPMMMLPSGQAVPVLPGPVQMPSVINLARPMCMVPNIPGIPGPSSGRLRCPKQSPSGHSMGIMAMGSSPMVPQRAEQSQLLVQQPDAPSPAQPQVSPAQPTGGRRRRTVDDDPDERRQRFLERKSGRGIALQTETQTVGQLPREEGRGALHPERLAVAAEESMKDTSEPTGSPAPVIQHSSLAPSPSAGQNGLSSRAAAEAMAMSVLAGMGQQQRAEGGPSHIIMAAQSQSAAR
ncbi:Cyclic AMP-dependent transcription factor ATF-7 [Collichthys lucidus]|uniref:Cyclic AMP-dependent transcription factor ATF-7 n=1 Tax=Collichthys lucidus TaxID=240159 RepID=A0A4U5UR37_COLLU|nr:Cyclic AMP-dependent transcription factor ATF-7 [Collichthys lucidus]